MKLYLITTDGEVDYDEFIGAVIAAESEAQVGGMYRGLPPWTIVQIGTTDSYPVPAMVLESFNAG